MDAFVESYHCDVGMSMVTKDLIPKKRVVLHQVGGTILVVYYPSR